MNREVLKQHLEQKYRQVFHSEAFIGKREYLELLVDAGIRHCFELTGRKPEDMLWKAGRQYPGERFEDLKYSIVAGEIHSLLALPGNYSKLRTILFKENPDLNQPVHQSA